MFIKIDEKAIFCIEDVVIVGRKNDTIYITFRNVDNPLRIEEHIDTKNSTRKEYADRVYDFIWNAICDYRKHKSDYKGITREFIKL